MCRMTGCLFLGVCLSFVSVVWATAEGVPGFSFEEYMAGKVLAMWHNNRCAPRVWAVGSGNA